MTASSMTRKEIAEHLLSEVRKNRSRIINKVGIVAKKMLKTEIKTQTYKQRVGTNTLFTIYIYGFDKIGVDYAIGCWYNSDKGLCWASVGVNTVEFYSAHFFERYAERYLKKSMSVPGSAREFYSKYQVAFGQNGEEIASGIYKAQLTLHNGLALGFNDTVNG